MAITLKRTPAATGAPSRPLVAGALWTMIDGEIGQWRRRGRSPVFWWRDDDARRPSPGLERLIGLSRAHGVPVALAVVPDVDLGDLARRIAAEPLIHPIQHGCDHLDRNQAGGFSAEFDPLAPPDQIASAINTAWGRLRASTCASPIYAPPWNVMTPNVAAALRRTPLRAISLYGSRPDVVAAPPQINTHIDVMAWRPARFRGDASLAHRLWRQLRTRRLRGEFDRPVGFLTHHRNLDEGSWRFVGELLGRLEASSWRTPDQLLDLLAPSPAATGG